MRRRAWVGVVLLAGSLFAEPAAQSPLTESINVEVVNLDVIVTDAKGARVTGLSRDDFRVIEDDRPQQISNFSEYRIAGSAGAEDMNAPAVDAAGPVETMRRDPLRLVILIDNSTLHVAARSRIVPMIEKFVRESLAPSDEVSVVTWGRSLQTLTPFTTSRTAVAAALDRASARTPSGSEKDSEDQGVRDREAFRTSAASSTRAPKGGTSPADAAAFERMAIASDRRKELVRTAEAARSLVIRLAGLEGKRAMLLVTDGFAANSAGLPEVGIADPLYDTSESMKAIAETANANNVTLYSLHASGVEHQVDTPDIASPTGSGARELVLLNSTMTLGMLSGTTGGLVASSPNAVPKFLDEIASDMKSYYSLAYHPQGRTRSGSHRVVVTTIHPGYRVRSRSRYVEKTPEDTLKDQLLASLYYDTNRDEMHVSGSVGRAKPAGRRRYMLPLEIRFPMKSLTFVPQGTQQVAGFKVLVISSDDPERATDVTTKEQRVAIPAAKFATAQKQGCVYALDLLSSGKGGVVAVAVRDEVSGATSILKVPLPEVR